MAAIKRRLPFSLTEQELTAIIGDSKCFYCEGPIGGGMGVDRTDLSKSIGYVSFNLIKCCKECNVLKNNLLSHEEMIELVKLLRKMRNTDNIWENVRWRKKST